MSRHLGRGLRRHLGRRLSRHLGRGLSRHLGRRLSRHLGRGLGWYLGRGLSRHLGRGLGWHLGRRLVGILVGQTVPVGSFAVPNVLTLGPFQFGLPIVRCSEEQIGTVPLSVTTMFLKKPGGKHVCDSSPYAKASEKPLPES